MIYSCAQNIKLSKDRSWEEGFCLLAHLRPMVALSRLLTEGKDFKMLVYDS